MTDQATTLRTIAAAGATGPLGDGSRLAPRRSFAITSGKGGVGKSNLAVNLSLALGLLGNRVSLLDADMGLANADLICGVTPKYHLGHAVKGLKRLEEIAISLSANVDLVPGGSGIEELANLSLESLPSVAQQLRVMEESVDLMVIDTAAGIAKNVSDVLASASDVIVVLTSEPTSIVDSYALIKLVQRRVPGKPISIVVNKSVGIGEAYETFQCVSGVVERFLGREVEYLGMVPHDPQVQDAICEQIPVIVYAPEAPASRAIRLIARQLHRRDQNLPAPARVASFFEALAGDQPLYI